MLRRLQRVGVSSAQPQIAPAFGEAVNKIGIRRSVRVLQSTIASVPMVIGYFRPIILMPLSVVNRLSSQEVEAILAHELAHIRRHDFVVNLLQTLLETVCFYHPAVWWLSYRLRSERELCCDALAAESLDSPAVYARALLALEELRGTAPVLWGGPQADTISTETLRCRSATVRATDGVRKTALDS